MQIRLKSIIIIALTLLITACNFSKPYYTSISNSKAYNLEELFNLLDTNTLNEEERYAVIMKITDAYSKEKDYDRLISFLTDMVSIYPNSIYNSRYLLGVAWAYSQQNTNEIAALYYDRIVKNFPDLIINNESIHCACLKQLINLTDDVARRIEFRKDLLVRFNDTIDEGTNYFLLGKDYEAIGDWDNAIDSYKRFLLTYKTDIPGYPNAVQDSQQFVNFATVKKDWTYETLDEVVNVIKVALTTGNTLLLSRARAKVGFFAMNWHQDANDGTSQILFNFGNFMRSNRIRVSENLDSSSNSKEAYLRTTGWADRVSTWYFYFKKINFPADPEIHGRWEWAGVYFGEKLQ